MASNDRKSEILIPNDQLLPGCYIAAINASDYLETCDSLLIQKKFKSAIALSTISLEESLKGVIIFRKFRKDESITRGEWKQLQRQEHKLMSTWLDNINIMSKSTEDMRNRVQEEFQKAGLLKSKIREDQFVSTFRMGSKLFSNFSKLTEYCFTLIGMPSITTGRYSKKSLQKIRNLWHTLLFLLQSSSYII